jgi:hypothetical protein
VRVADEQLDAVASGEDDASAVTESDDSDSTEDFAVDLSEFESADDEKLTPGPATTPVWKKRRAVMTESNTPKV